MASPMRRKRRLGHVEKEELTVRTPRRSARLRSSVSAKPHSPRNHSRVFLQGTRKLAGAQETPNVDNCVDVWLNKTYDPSVKSSLKRKRSGDLENDSSPAPLTKRNLRIVEKMGKSSASAKSSNSGRKTSEGSKSTTTPSRVQSSSKATVSTTDSQFPRLAQKNGILPPYVSADPDNLDALREKLNRQRATASPTETQYKKFRRKIGAVQNEGHLKQELDKVLFKDYANEDADEDENEHYTKIPNQAFTAFPKNVGFNNGMSAPQPDIVEGLHMSDFIPFPIDEILGGAAVLTNNENPIALPHIAGELKAPGKDTKRAAIQAAYDGAAMVYGRAKANEYLGTPDAAGHAYVTTFTTDGSSISTYAHYASSSGSQFKYHQAAITNASLITDYQSFKTGRRQLRNLQDHAREMSYDLRDRLVASHRADDHGVLVDNNRELSNNYPSGSNINQELQAVPADHLNKLDTVHENHEDSDSDALGNETYQLVEIAEAGPHQGPHPQLPLDQSATYVTPPITEPVQRRSERHSKPRQKYRRGRKKH